MGRRIAGAVAAVALCGACLAGLAGCSSPAGGDADGDLAGVAAVFGENHRIMEDEVTSYAQDFREKNDLVDDESWGQYLEAQGMTASEWRDEAIRGLVDRVLIEERAEEYGISPDEKTIDARIAQLKEAAGIDEGDDEAWAEYLAKQGDTPEGLRDTYAFSSIEQQVFSRDIDFDDEARDDLCNDYIRANLADQIVHRYSALEFDLDDEAGARACIAELGALQGDGLAARFDELAHERYERGMSSSEDGDIGWDFMYDEWAIDPDLVLRKAQLQPGSILPEPLKGEDCYRVVLCTGHETFEMIDYASLEDESLRDTIAALAQRQNWVSLGADYLADIEKEAEVKVAPMPEGLPYDVEVSD